MIGVISKPGESSIVREFFQLFKTPWEFFIPGRGYDTVLATSDEIPENLNTKLLVVYSSQPTAWDKPAAIRGRAEANRSWLAWDGVEFPVYGPVAVLECAGRAFIRRRDDASITGIESDQPFPAARIGYDLFEEIGLLLSKGQPRENAHLPTLEIHISLLRSMMLRAGISFLEVPPVPAGYDFMACLTHDVDFTGIREHKGDHTLWGFLYRASVSSTLNAVKGRIPWSRCFQNWRAILSLPLVFLGLQEDFWLEFDRYMEIEKGLGSTFYFIPFRNDPGIGAPSRRGAKYDFSKLKKVVRKLIDNGCEVGLHGIDAWQDGEKGRAELARICESTGAPDAGVRIHWLYFSEASPKILENVGLSYDSTFGYNDAVGFRAGTSQAFCPPSAKNLLELPLNIQDTALFYPGRLNLSEGEALDSCKQLVQFLSLFGGALTLNWHTRSLSPERLWGEFYGQLLQLISSHRVWFATGSEITAWFRKRRELSFDLVQIDPHRLHLRLGGAAVDANPPFIVRVYRPKARSSAQTAAVSIPTPFYSDRVWDGQMEVEISS